MNKFFVSAFCLFIALFTNVQLNAQSNQQLKKEGRASFYHDKFNGRKTATGEIFRNSGYTAASNHFPLGTYVKVTNKKNGKSIYVKINDRMGHKGRVIDLTNRAAKDLNFVNSGLTQVEIVSVSSEEGKRKILAQNEHKSESATTGKTL